MHDLKISIDAMTGEAIDDTSIAAALILVADDGTYGIYYFHDGADSAEALAMTMATIADDFSSAEKDTTMWGADQPSFHMPGINRKH